MYTIRLLIEHVPLLSYNDLSSVYALSQEATTFAACKFQLVQVLESCIFASLRPFSLCHVDLLKLVVGAQSSSSFFHRTSRGYPLKYCHGRVTSNLYTSRPRSVLLPSVRSWSLEVMLCPKWALALALRFSYPLFLIVKFL